MQIINVRKFKKKIGGKVKLITVGKMVVRTVSGLQRHRTKDS